MVPRDKSVEIGSVYAEKHTINNHTQEITQIQVHEEEENSNDTSKELLTRAMLVKWKWDSPRREEIKNLLWRLKMRIFFVRKELC